MIEPIDISVVICTYNRCDMLESALASVLAQGLPAHAYEVIVVDNNSSDRTREVVESLIARGHGNLRYLFEGRQGLSHARNTGVAAAQAPIVTFTDDDIRASPDWISSIKRAFEAHPEVDIVGGKVLPRWNAPPPSWLTLDHWSPLAIVDQGNEPFYTNLKKQYCLVGANLSVRRKTLQEVGPFLADFQRVKDGIGSTEDHEFQLRVWRAGKQGLYQPDVVVTADIQNDRLTKAYHRRWHRGHGAFCARMGLVSLPADGATLFGVPAYFYGSVVKTAACWLSSVLTRNEAAALLHEMQLRYAASYIRMTYSLTATGKKRGLGGELFGFVRSLVRKKYASLVTRVINKSS